MTEERKNMFNILLLSISFMLVFTGFHTLSSMQSLVRVDKSQGGLVHLAIVYVFFGIFSWISPSLLNILGPRYYSNSPYTNKAFVRFGSCDSRN